MSVTISYYDTVEAPVNSSDDFIEKSFYKKVFDRDILPLGNAADSHRLSVFRVNGNVDQCNDAAFDFG